MAHLAALDNRARDQLRMASSRKGQEAHLIEDASLTKDERKKHLEHVLLEQDKALTDSDHLSTVASEMQKREEEKDVAVAASASTPVEKEQVGWLRRLWRRGKSHETPKESTSGLKLQPIVFA